MIFKLKSEDDVYIKRRFAFFPVLVNTRVRVGYVYGEIALKDSPDKVLSWLVPYLRVSNRGSYIKHNGFIVEDSRTKDSVFYGFPPLRKKALALAERGPLFSVGRGIPVVTKEDLEL